MQNLHDTIEQAELHGCQMGDFSQYRIISVSHSLGREELIESCRNTMIQK